MTDSLQKHLQNPEVLKAIQSNPIYKVLNTDPILIQNLQADPKKLNSLIQGKLSSLGLTPQEQVIIMFAHLDGHALEKVEELTGATASTIHMCYDNGMAKLKPIVDPTDVKHLFK